MMPVACAAAMLMLKDPSRIRIFRIRIDIVGGAGQGRIRKGGDVGGLCMTVGWKFGHRVVSDGAVPLGAEYMF